MSDRKAPPYLYVEKKIDAFFSAKGRVPAVRELHKLCGGEGSLSTYSEDIKTWHAAKIMGSGAIASILSIQQQAKAHAEIIDAQIAQLLRALGSIGAGDDSFSFDSSGDQLEEINHGRLDHDPLSQAKALGEVHSPTMTAPNDLPIGEVDASTTAPFFGLNGDGEPVQSSDEQGRAPFGDKDAATVGGTDYDAPRHSTGHRPRSTNATSLPPSTDLDDFDMDRYTLREDDDGDPALRHHLSAVSMDREHVSRDQKAGPNAFGEHGLPTDDASLSRADGGGMAATHPAGANKPGTGESDTSAKGLSNASTSPVNEQPSVGEPAPHHAGSGEPPLVSTKPTPFGEAK